MSTGPFQQIDSVDYGHGVMYRFRDVQYSSLPDPETGECRGVGELKIELHTYPILRRTPHGVWINGDLGERFVLLSARKRFACETIDEARTSFLARKKRQASIYRARLAQAERAIRLAQDTKEG